MYKTSEMGTFIIRVVLGIIFMVHGLMKFQGGIENTAGFFESIGLPGFAAYAVGGIELIGGISVILGLGTRILSAAFAVIMIGAIVMLKLAKGFAGGYEFELALLAMSLHLSLSANQSLSLDNLFFKKKENIVV